MQLSGKIIWLTGASSGIGAALAYELASRGVKLALTARNGAKLTALAEDLRGAGAVAAVFTGDVTDLAEMKRISAEIEHSLGPIDLLLANAGTHFETWPENFNSVEYQNLMNINYGGLLHCLDAVLPQMLLRGTGTVVGIASLAGYRGLPRAGAYGASKAAMIHFLESVRFHLRPRGIKVVVVNPGFVKTPLTDKNNFQMPFLIDAKRAAKFICRGLELERDRIAFPAPFSWFMGLLRIVPFFIYDFLVEKQWRRMQKN